MKKILLLSFLSLFAVFPLFCQESIPGRRIYIDGTAPRSEQLVFFMTNFNMEMSALGYNVIGTKDEADYIFKFNVAENMILYADGISRSAPAGEPRWFIQISLIIKETNVELISFSFPFTELEEMYEYNQYLFYRVMINIPLDSIYGEGSYDTRWQNKLLYFGLTADYKISYFQVTDYEKKLFSDYNASEANVVYGLPSLTVGIEYQFLNFLSVEGIFEAYFGDPVNYYWSPFSKDKDKKDRSAFNTINIQAGVNVKYNFKRPNYMMSPYASFNYPLKSFGEGSTSTFPKFSIGGGVQIAFRAAKSSAFFVNAGYQQFLGNVVTNHPQLDNEIKYTHFTLSIGFGYKYGFIDRKKK
jgi:hypothetical protein